MNTWLYKFFYWMASDSAKLLAKMLETTPQHVDGEFLLHNSVQQWTNNHASYADRRLIRMAMDNRERAYVITRIMHMSVVGVEAIYKDEYGHPISTISPLAGGCSINTSSSAGLQNAIKNAADVMKKNMAQSYGAGIQNLGATPTKLTSLDSDTEGTP